MAISKFGPLLGIKKLSKTIKDKDTQIILDNIENGLIGLHNSMITNLNGLQLVKVPSVITTVGTFNFNLDSTTKYVRITMSAGGGGGGGTTGGAGTIAAAGGGGLGAFLQFVIVTGPSRLINGTIGAAGLGGNAAPGGNGLDTIIIINGTTYTAKGGLGGNGMAATAASLSAPGGGTGAGSTNVSGILTGGNGGTGIVIAGQFSYSGYGASGPMGYGGLGLNSLNAESGGIVGTGAGSGGSGSRSVLNNQTGGNGARGQVIVEELA